MAEPDLSYRAVKSLKVIIWPKNCNSPLTTRLACHAEVPESGQQIQIITAV